MAHTHTTPFLIFKNIYTYLIHTRKSFFYPSLPQEEDVVHSRACDGQLSSLSFMDVNVIFTWMII